MRPHKTREQMAENMRRVQPLGTEAVTKHGVRALQLSRPERWPEPIRVVYLARIDELEELPHLAGPRFAGIRHQVSWLECMVGAARHYIATSGLTKPDGEPHGLMKFALSLENSLSRAYQTAGLTPAANIRYIAQPDSLLTALAGLQDAEDTDSEDRPADGHQDGENDQ